MPGENADKTFLGQSNYIMKLPGEDRFIAMFDKWDPKSLMNSRYLWLPVDFDAEVFLTSAGKMNGPLVNESD